MSGYDSDSGSHYRPPVRNPQLKLPTHHSIQPKLPITVAVSKRTSSAPYLHSCVNMQQHFPIYHILCKNAQLELPIPAVGSLLCKHT